MLGPTSTGGSSAAVCRGCKRLAGRAHASPGQRVEIIFKGCKKYLHLVAIETRLAGEITPSNTKNPFSSLFPRPFWAHTLVTISHHSRFLEPEQHLQEKTQLTFSPKGCPGLFRRTFWSLPVFLSAERMVLLFVSDQKSLSLKTATEKGFGVSANCRI